VCCVALLITAAVWGPRLAHPLRSTAAGIAAPVVPEKKSIAVLPLASVADDPKLTAFGKGLLEDVAAKLSQLSANHDLEIISPRALEDKKINTLADAKKELGVNLGLAVSLKQDGDLVRASYNLIDTSTDKNLTGDSITAPVSDLFTIEDKLTSDVADALHISLRSEERQALGAHATLLPEAYQLCLGRCSRNDMSVAGRPWPKPDAFLASRVENRRSDCSLPVDIGRGFRRATSVRFGLVLFPVPAHRTGLADFPHPALGKDTRCSV
jgi:TolB-like protein